MQPAATRNARHDCLSKHIVARAPMRAHAAAYGTLQPDHLGGLSEGRLSQYPQYAQGVPAEP